MQEIQVTLKFTSMAEAAAFFAGHSVELSTTVGDSPITVTAAEVTEFREANGGSLMDAKAGAAAKRTRKSKTEQIAPADAAASPATPEPEPESGKDKVTIEQVREALQAYVGKHDFNKGQELVRSFSKADGTPVTRLSELQESDWAQFVAATKAEK